MKTFLFLILRFIILGSSLALALYLSLISGALLLFLYVIVIGISIYAIIKTRSTYLTYSFIAVGSVFFAILLSDIYSLNTEDEKIRPERIREGITDSELRLYSSDFASGYMLNDGTFTVSEYAQVGGELYVLYENVEYIIKKNIRISGLIESELEQCPDVILLGGSHNFGQGLPLGDTLQGLLISNGRMVLNLSIPGFGLSNSVALLGQRANRERLEILCDGDSRPLLVYRFIANHVLRDAGKTALNLNGPDYRFRLPDERAGAYCEEPVACLSYLTTYVASRALYYLSTTRYERSGRIIGSKIASHFHYTDSDFNASRNVLLSLADVARKIEASGIIFIIEGSGEVVNRYLKLVEDIVRAKVILPLDYKATDACSDLPVKSDYIEFEGHPTACLNKRIFGVLADHMNL